MRRSTSALVTAAALSMAGAVATADPGGAAPSVERSVDVVQVAPGQWHTCVLLDDTTIRCWGWNQYGQLGDGTTNSQATPTTVVREDGTPFTGTVSLVAGTVSTCALSGSGRVQCWGYGRDGRLGDGSRTDRSNPTLVRDRLDEPLDGITQISSGDTQTCAVSLDGRAQCWGGNSYGQIGDGTHVRRVHPALVRRGDGRPLEDVALIAAGASHTCVAFTTGNASCWGFNAYGQLGRGTTRTRYHPVPVLTVDHSRLRGVVGISAGYMHSCAVLDDGTARCWGLGRSGQLGMGGHGARHHPATVVLTTERPLTGVVQLAAGYAHTCATLVDGSVRCWGSDDEGQLGGGTGRNHYHPAAVVGEDGTPLGDATAVATRESHTCVVLADASVRCWGANQLGQIGDGTTADQSHPIEPLGL